MPDPIELPRKLKAQGWKVKVYDNERLEPPHLTLICRERVWRIGLQRRRNSWSLPVDDGETSTQP